MAGQMIRQASILIDRGIGEEVRLLEYFGDNPERRRYVGTVATAVRALLERSAELYESEQAALEDKIVTAEQREVQLAVEAQNASRQARSLIPFADYYRVLGTDPDTPARINLAEDVASALAPLDVARNPNRSFVELMLGKIYLARGGKEGRTKARDYYERAIAGTDNPVRLFDAYFGRTVVEALDGNAIEARTEYERFGSWLSDQPPESVPGRQPLLLVAGYRVAEANAVNAESADDRAEAEEESTRLLMTLVEEYEGYRPVVTGQLLARLKGNDELESLSPLLLDAIVDRGRQEAAKAAAAATEDAEATYDEETIRRAIAAAEELQTRLADGADVDATATARAVFLAALMRQTLGEQMEAVDLFLEYGEMPAADPDQRRGAYRRALGLIEEVRSSSDTNERTELAADEREAKLLPILIDEFGDVERAFDLAVRLQKQGDLEGAITYYGKVPDADPRLPTARQNQFLAVAEQVSQTAGDDPLYGDLVARAISQGEQALTTMDAAAAEASAKLAEVYRTRAADTRIALARLRLNERDEAQAAIDLLADLEQRVEGLPDARVILDDALPLRFQAQAAAGDVDGATADLLKLLDDSEPLRGFRYIEQFRTTLADAYDRAEARGDDEARRRLILTRAAVTPRLVEWIERSPDAEYRKYAYTFRTLDAETQYQAALEEPDADARERRLRTALERYEKLGEAENVDRFRQLIIGLTDDQRSQVAYDPEVLLNQARIFFELGEYADARQRLGRLLNDRTLGEPTRSEMSSGVTRIVPNDNYWEAQLRYIQTGLRGSGDEEDAVKLLRRLVALNGDAVGGTKWQDEFAELKRQHLSE